MRLETGVCVCVTNRKVSMDKLCVLNLGGGVQSQLIFVKGLARETKLLYG